MKTRKRSFSIRHAGQRYTVELVQRPFREGLEAVACVEGQVIRVAEQGMGREALRQKLLFEIQRVFAQSKKS